MPVVACLLMIVGHLSAEDASKKEKILSQITVAGNQEKFVAGSSEFITPEELQKSQKGFDDVNRVLRQVPGVNIQEEDGFGLRPNIGLRGASSERSASITLMEDSVLIAPAPYSAPAAYLFPPIGRMESVEVVKGPGQIKYGPRTNGGSLNMISTSIPEELTIDTRLQAGEFDSKLGHVKIGNSYENVGFLMETYQAENDGFKNLDFSNQDTGYTIEDYLGKFRINSSPDAEVYQELEFKFDVYKQDANETYLGLTREDFDADPFRRYSASQEDRINVEHEQLQLRHFLEVNEDLNVTTTLYRNDTKRNWHKLERVNGMSNASVLADPIMYAAELDILRGADSEAEALTVRNNNRKYLSRGIESVVSYGTEAVGAEHNFQFGVRYHEDHEDRYQHNEYFQNINTQMVLNRVGDPGSDSNRLSEAKAWAFYLTDEIKVDELTVTPGFRYENVDLSRMDYGKEDPMRTGIDMTESSNSVNAFLPGVSANYQISKHLNVYSGIHKGFAPPGAGSTEDVQEEESVNYEAGFDYRDEDLATRVTFFYSDYENLLGADTVSAGGLGTGDVFNAGESTVYGVEAQFAVHLYEDEENDLKFPFRINYTYTNAEFDESFDSDLFGEVTAGDALPYLPENQLYASLGVEYQDVSVDLGLNYQDAMDTNQAGVQTDTYAVFDLNVNYDVNKQVALFATVQNLFDREYAVAAKPAGFRPGLPQAFFMGVNYKFGGGQEDYSAPKN